MCNPGEISQCHLTYVLQVTITYLLPQFIFVERLCPISLQFQPLLSRSTIDDFKKFFLSLEDEDDTDDDNCGEMDRNIMTSFVDWCSTESNNTAIHNNDAEIHDNNDDQE